MARKNWTPLPRREEKVGVLKPDTLYLGDNGRIFCRTHAGMTAFFTGRDLSGQKVMEVTPEVHRSFREMGVTPRCETPGCSISCK